MMDGRKDGRTGDQMFRAANVQDAFLMLRDETQQRSCYTVFLLWLSCSATRRDAANGIVTPNGSETLCHAGPGGLESKLITCGILPLVNHIHSNPI